MEEGADNVVAATRRPRRRKMTVCLSRAARTKEGSLWHMLTRGRRRARAMTKSVEISAPHCSDCKRHLGDSCRHMIWQSKRPFITESYNASRVKANLTFTLNRATKRYFLPETDQVGPAPKLPDNNSYEEATITTPSNYSRINSFRCPIETHAIYPQLSKLPYRMPEYPSPKSGFKGVV